MYYTCLPIIERLPFKHPEKFYELVNEKESKAPQ